MKKIVKAIIFDYGGVISKDQDSNTVDEIAELLDLETNIFKNSYRYFRPDYDSNKISATQYWIKILVRNKKTISEDIINQLITLDVKSWAQINRDTLDYIYKLNKCNVKIAIISNMTLETLEYVNKHFKWLKMFESLIFSCDLKVSKPQSEIYNKCLVALNLSPHKCLFVDDSLENIRGAKKIGLNTLLFNGTKQFIDELNSKYIFD